MSRKTILIDIDIKLIQQLRLIHALAEAGFVVRVRKDDVPKFKLLSQEFGMHFEVGSVGDMKLSEIAKIDHKTPATSVGSLRRTLILPHSVTNYCRSLWPATRKHRFTFAGLVTKSRKAIIEDWVKRNSTAKPSGLPNADSIYYKLRRRFYAGLRLDDSLLKELGNLVVWSSTRGRKYPEKSWDDRYFRFLSDSQLVLCPNGNSVWSYRFFESILCGAIPVIEEMCPAYDGFKFYSMSADSAQLEWSHEVAEGNYKLCLERVTIAPEELRSELQET